MFDDVARIEAFTGKPARTLFVASLGSLVGRGGFRPQVFRVGSITPRGSATGRCAFLTSDERCSIHAVAPFGCRMFDAHMGPDVSEPRSAWAIRDHLRPEYQILRSTLEPALTWKGQPL